MNATSPPTPPAIMVEDLRVVRGGRPVIPELSWSVPAGRICGLIGPSGCGKSTLMRALVGVQVVASGRVTVLGRPAGDRDLRRRVGYVTQSPSVYRDLSVDENLRYFAAVLGVPRRQTEGEVSRVLDLVDLHRQASDRADRLSGGQLSRVSLAVALIGRPELLVLDEPTVGLDPVLRRDLWRLFGNLAAAGTTLVVSSHVMDEARHCERLLLMREGRALADDTPQGVQAHTGTHDIESAFLALVSDHPAEREDGPAGNRTRLAPAGRQDRIR